MRDTESSRSEQAAEVDDVILEGEPELSSDEESDKEYEDPWFNTGIPLELVLTHLHKDQVASRLLFDFIVYVPYLVMFIFFFIGLVGTDTERNVTHQFYVAKSMRDRIWEETPRGIEVYKPAHENANSEDWTVWTQSIVVPSMWSCKPANSAQVSPQLTFMGQNYLLGALRFRTKRMQRASCTANDHLFDAPAEEPECYAGLGGAQEKTVRHGFPHPALYPTWTDLVTDAVAPPTGVHLAEIFFGVEQLGVPTLVPPLGVRVANYRGVHAPQNVPQFAVDSEEETDWVDDDLGKLLVVFPTPTRVHYFSFMTGSRSVAEDPVQWRLLGSRDNGTSWNVLHDQTRFDYIVPATRRKRLPWFRLATNSTETYDHFKFVPLKTRQEPGTQWRVNWEPSPFDKESLGFSDLKRGLVEGESDLLQLSEIRLRTAELQTIPIGGAGVDITRVDLGRGFGGMAGAGSTASLGGGAGGVVNATEAGAAIDGDADTMWVTQAGGQIVVTLPAASMRRIHDYTFVTGLDRPWRDPVRWTVEGSNSPTDPNSWVMMDRVMSDHDTPLRRRAQMPWMRLNHGTTPRVFSSYRFTLTKARGGVALDRMLYHHQKCKSGFGVLTFGDIETYDCGGYSVDVPFDTSCDVAMSVVRAFASVNYPLVDNFATRLSVVEYFVYSPQSNEFFEVRFYAETAAGGMWHNKNEVRAFVVWSTVFTGQTVYDFFVYMFVAYYMVNFCKDWRKYGKTQPWYLFLTEVWNLLEMAILVAFMTVFVFRMMWMAKSKQLSLRMSFPRRYPHELEQINYLYTVALYALSICTVLIFIKFLKYVRLNNRLSLLTRTISESKEMLAGCLVIFVYILLAYALAGNALYGAQVFDYHTLGMAFETLGRILLGDFDYWALYNENRILAGFFFWSFVVLALYIMLNFIVAILMTNFSILSIAKSDVVPIDEQMQKLWWKLKRKLHPARLTVVAKNLLQGNSHAALMERAMINMVEYWKLLHVCSTCGSFACCVCKFSNSNISKCARCGAVPSCLQGGGAHHWYANDQHLVYRYELRSLIGAEPYDHLGADAVDDLWQEILWAYDLFRVTDKATQAEETEDLVTDALHLALRGHDGTPLGSLSEVGLLDAKVMMFEQENER